MKLLTLKLVLPLTIIFFILSGHANEEALRRTVQQPVAQKVSKVDTALKFINGYVENCKKLNDNVDMVEWVNSNDLTTAGFKAELQRMVDEAYEAEPETGLDFDPILDAQDNPDEGFELESFDETTNYLTVKGKDWPEFIVTMKIRDVGGNWLVDGCGVVNIPNDKRAPGKISDTGNTPRQNHL